MMEKNDKKRISSRYGMFSVVFMKNGRSEKIIFYALYI